MKSFCAATLVAVCTPSKITMQANGGTTEISWDGVALTVPGYAKSDDSRFTDFETRITDIESILISNGLTASTDHSSSISANVGDIATNALDISTQASRQMTPGAKGNQGEKGTHTVGVNGAKGQTGAKGAHTVGAKGDQGAEYVPPTCDGVAAAPANGAAGDCSATMASGSTCLPTCNSGYTVSGSSSCFAGIVDAATCVEDAWVLPIPTVTQTSTGSIDTCWGGTAHDPDSKAKTIAKFSQNQIFREAPNQDRYACTGDYAVGGSLNDGDVSTCGTGQCGACSLYGYAQNPSPGPVKITYDFGERIDSSSSNPVELHYATNGYHGTGVLNIYLDGVLEEATGITRRVNGQGPDGWSGYTPTWHTYSVTKHFNTISFEIDAGVSGTGPNPNFKVCSIAYGY